MSFELLVEHLDALLGESLECEWVECKENNSDPEEIGEYISAIANSATLAGRARGFIIWGIRDGSREIVGTTFRPRNRRIGNEELEMWLSRHLSPRIDFRVHESDVDDKRVVVIEVPAANHAPVRFRNAEYIRVGTYKKLLRDFLEKERALWAALSRTAFEHGIVRAGIGAADVLRVLDARRYFELARLPVPSEPRALAERMVMEKFVIARDDGLYDVTNLGAIAFARNLDELGLARKGVRVVVYSGTDRIQGLRERPGTRGYAIGFGGLVRYINDQLPSRERIEESARTEDHLYPVIAIREVVANAIIHQDFTMIGSGPMVEIFSDRIEVTSPGVPLIDVLRFLDLPPQSRNDAFASLMRRLSFCEERGSGIDKVVWEVEKARLPAPKFEILDNHTRVTLFGPRSLSEMSKEDRVRACYQHACLLAVSSRQMTNASLRERFSIDEQNAAQASRIIADTLAARLVKPSDAENRSRRMASYIPFWA